MSSKLINHIFDKAPKFNEDICRGLAYQHLKSAREYVRQVLLCASKSFPEGFEFRDVVLCNPYEQYNEITRKQFNKHRFELAESDVYLVKLIFAFEGKELPPKYMFLPFCHESGGIRIRNTWYYIAPVIADKAFSVESDGLFVPLTRAKLNFTREMYSFITNNIREHGAVIASPIHNDKSNGGGFKTLIAHYLFAQVGVVETFKNYFDVDVVVGGDEINEENYNHDKWVVCSSIHAKTGTKPKAIRTRGLYTPTKVRLAIPKSQYTTAVRDVVASFFYVLDLFPDRLELDYIHDTREWRVVLGRIIKKDRGEGKLINEIDFHLSCVNDYLDILSIEMFHREGIEVNDIWELFKYIIENMTEIITKTDRASMFNKRLVVLRYVLFDITYSIFSTLFALTRGKREYTYDKINEILSKELKRDAVFKLIDKRHGEKSTHLVSGDNYFLKITSAMVHQTRANDSYGSGVKSDPAMVLHSSQAVVGSYLNQPKSNPTGRESINPFLQTDQNDGVLENPKWTPTLDSIEELIRRR